MDFKEYELCNIKSVVAHSASMFSNGDLLLLDIISVSNIPSQYTLNLEQSCLMVRIDSETGQTLWAKDILFATDYIILHVQNVDIWNDTIWSYSTMYRSSTYKEVVCQTDSNGYIIKCFSVINPINAQQTNLIFFVIEGIQVVDNDSIFLYGETSFYKQQMGVSENSQIDTVLFKYDSNMKIQWYTAIDFHNNIDYCVKLSILNESIYTLFESQSINLCLAQLSLKDGTYINSTCVKSGLNYNSSKIRFNMILTSQNYIFVRDNYQDSNGYLRLLIFNICNSISLVKILKIKKFQYATGITFENIKYSESLINQSGNQIDIISFDDNLNINCASKYLNDQSPGTIYYKLLALNSNDSFYLIYSEKVTIDANTIFVQSKISSHDLSFNSKGCNPNTLITGNQTCAFDTPFGYGDNTYFEYSVINASISVAYYQGTPDTASYDVTSDAFVFDLTDCIWPRFDCELNNCYFPLPEFVLNPEYSIQIGTKNSISKTQAFIPFKHCQNAKFRITVVDLLTNIQPSWISIDQNLETVIIDTTNLTSVFTTQLLFSAQMITFSNNQGSRYTTKNYTSIFVMENTNCELVSAQFKNHLVLNKISNFSFEFEDIEGDNVKIKVGTSSYFSSFVQYLSSDSTNILVMPQQSTENEVDFYFMYSDSFHQSNTDWMLFSSKLNIFASEPPVFVRSLDAIVVSRCQDVNYVLPDFSDSDSFNITAKFDGNVPNWVVINNFTISINSKSGQNVTDGLTQVGLILVDETNSWTKYTFNITVKPVLSTVFGLIPNIDREKLAKDGILINVTSANQINVVNCFNNNIIENLIIDNFKLKLTTDLASLTQKCFKLMSIDNCGNKEYSNSFYILSSEIKPPSVTYNLDPFSVPKGIYTLYELPDYLFTDFSVPELAYSASIVSCTQKNFIDVGLKSSSDNKVILYVFSSFTMSCEASLYVSNSHQSSEIIITLNVISCSSKNCVKCSGPYQSQCTECAADYMLEQSGMCLRKMDYFSFEDITFFKVCGIISFVFFLLHLTLSILFGRRLLNKIGCIQIVIIFMIQSNTGDSGLKDFLANILFIKFDFGFMYELLFSNENSLCETESDKMADLQFYCQTTIQNYLFLLVAILIWFISWKFCICILKCQRIKMLAIYAQNFKFYVKFNTIRSNFQQFIEWFCINCVLMFIILNLTNDFINFTKHLLMSLLSLLLIILFCFYLIKTHFKILQFQYLKEIEPEYRSISDSILFKSLPYFCLLQYLLGSMSFVLNNTLFSVFACILTSFIQINKAMFLIELKLNESVAEIIIRWFNIVGKLSNN